MLARGLKFALLLTQAFWMIVVLPGHVRGMIVVAPTSHIAADGCADSAVRTTASHPTAHASCCDADDAPPRPGAPISPERRARCAVCYQAVGYDLPAVFDVDLAPTGRCELCRLIEPSKRHRLLFDGTYNATAPPAVAVIV